MIRRLLALALVLAAAATAARPRAVFAHLAARRSMAAVPGAPARRVDQGLPASATTAAERLAKSPRHREDVMIPTPGVPGDSIHAWIFYPQVSGKAPVVVVIHEVFGMSTWVRAVGDQLAADGFIAIVPDLLHGRQLPGAPDSIPADAAIAAIRTLDPAAVQRDIDVAASYATHLPAALPVYATVGFCWGGGVSFAHDVHPSPSGAPALKATVVYYGAPPDAALLAGVRAPVLGLYGGNDARMSATVPGADSAMRQVHKTYEYKIYPGAGHGFLRAQDDMAGANATATQDAWPRTIAWFRKYLRA